MISDAKLYHLTETQVKPHDDHLSETICYMPSVSSYQGAGEMYSQTEKLLKNYKQ